MLLILIFILSSILLCYIARLLSTLQFAITMIFQGFSFKSSTIHELLLATKYLQLAVYFLNEAYSLSDCDDFKVFYCDFHVIGLMTLHK